jgi:hypothetical protein
LHECETLKNTGLFFERKPSYKRKKEQIIIILKYYQFGSVRIFNFLGSNALMVAV